ncbi:MAG: 2OG-Fe(II) oxygenase [Planctomycetota bacterium]|nr:2OG-Fe(II) oxygenase [Planctomycetota bacterium]
MTLRAGDPCPWFVGRTSSRNDFHFDTVAGRIIVLSFFKSAGSPAARHLLQGVNSLLPLFDDVTASFFGVSADPEDEAQKRVADRVPGVRWFWDPEGAIRLRCLAHESEQDITIVLDRSLRVLEIVRHDPPDLHTARLRRLLESLAPTDGRRPAPRHAPVILVERLFEPELCKELIRRYEQGGGFESGFMRQRGGRTVAIHDFSHKRRKDHVIEDPRLRALLVERIRSRLLPEIQKAYQYRATRIERYIVACYEAESSGHFRAHRDNTTSGTAHRRFAVSVNLNADFEGGELRFPEYSDLLYKPPPGAAVVFSCSLLHEASPVTAGKRYVFLPFLYDDDAAKIRIQNASLIDSPPPPAANAE